MAYLAPSSWPHKQCWGYVPCHRVGIQSNKSLVGYSHSFALLWHQYIFQEGYHWRAQSWKVGSCSQLSSPSVQSTFQDYGHLSGEAKALEWHPLDFPIFKEICRCCLQNWGLTISLWRATNNFGHSLYCLRVSMGPVWPTTQLDVAHSYTWSFIWWQEMFIFKTSLKFQYVPGFLC